MDKKKLELDFLDCLGKRFRIGLDDPNESIDKVEIETIMDEVIEQNIFISNESDLVGIEGARVVTTSVEEFIF